MSAGRTTFGLIRHARTVWNRERRIQGWSDSPLTPEGERQAELWGAHLQATPWTLILASDTGRAQATARIINRRLDLPPASRAAAARARLGAVDRPHGAAAAGGGARRRGGPGTRGLGLPAAGRRNPPRAARSQPARAARRGRRAARQRDPRRDARGRDQEPRLLSQGRLHPADRAARAPVYRLLPDLGRRRGARVGRRRRATGVPGG